MLAVISQAATIATMKRQPLTKSPAVTQSAWSPPATAIDLTPFKIEPGNAPSVVNIETSNLVAYAQCTGYTRLNLTGGRLLDVKETTDQIDRMVRIAASQMGGYASNQRQ